MSHHHKDSPEIAFFLGAGSSVPGGIKDVVRLVDDLVTWLGLEKQEHLNVTIEIINSIRKWEQKNSLDRYLNIETLLETVERMEGSFKDVLPVFFKDGSLNLKAEETEIIKSKSLSISIKQFILSKFQDTKDVDYYLPINRFISNYRPVFIFTTNYDLIIEQFCNSYNKEYSDLFIGDEWSPEIDKSKLDVIIHKLHGSINWYMTENGKYGKLPEQTNKIEFKLFTKEKAVPLILYPGKKLEYIEPTLEMINIFKNYLTKIKCCFVVGYSFKDEHLLKLFLYSARKNKDLHVFLISPSAHSIYYEKLKRYSVKEFSHAFTHESYSSKSFDTTIGSDLEGKVICLPYKFQNIFSKLLDYYDYLKRGLFYEKIIMQDEGKINALTGYLSGEPDSNAIELIDCLECFKNCEHFDKIEWVVSNKTDGWESIIKQVANANHNKDRLSEIFDIFLKSFFNRFSSNDREMVTNRLTFYLKMLMESLKIQIKNYFIRLNFQVEGVELPGHIGYKLNDLLENRFYQYNMIAELEEKETTYILNMIKKGKEFFQKWKNGEILLDTYVEKYVTNPIKKAEIINLKEKIKASHTSEEVIQYQNKICDIVLLIESQIG